MLRSTQPENCIPLSKELFKTEDSSRKCRGWFPRMTETTASRDRSPKKPYQVCSSEMTAGSFHFFFVTPPLLAVFEHMGSEGVPGAWFEDTKPGCQNGYREANRWFHIYLFPDRKWLHSTYSFSWNSWGAYMPSDSDSLRANSFVVVTSFHLFPTAKTWFFSP